MLRLLNHIAAIIKRVNQDRISVYAAQSSFFIIISAFPLVMLIIPLIQFITPLSQEDFTKVLTGLVPASFDSYVVSIVNELFTNSAGTIVSISALTATWSASKGIYALVQGFNSIHHTFETRNFVLRRLFSIVYTVAFVIIFIFCLAILMFGNRIQLLLDNAFPFIASISAYIISIRTLLAIAILMFFFALMYKVFPDKKLKFRRQLPGAMFATAGWISFSFFYSIYIDNYSSYSYIYGSLTAIILLMLWLYICMNILLIGAEINLYIDSLSPLQKSE